LRDLLTGLAILLLLSLTGATVAPHLIDWDARREQVSEAISTVLGQEVEVNGPIGLTLLPSPRLKLSHVRFKRGEAVQGSIGRLRAQLAIPPLLRGDIRVVEALVQGADIRLRAGPVDEPAGLPLAAVGLDRLRIQDSRLAVIRPDGAPTFEAERIDGEVEATSLIGPMRGALSFDVQGDRRTLRFSTGRAEAGGLRIRALIENQVAATRTDYDGWLRYDGGVFSADGSLAASGNATIPLDRGTGHLIWRLAAKLKAAGAAARLDNIELALGNTERQTILTGSGDVDFSRAGSVARAILSTRQLDIDRLLAGEEARPTQTPEGIIRGLVESLAAGPEAQPWLTGELELSAGSLLFGGETIAAPRALLRADGVGVALAQFSAELPGRTQVSFESAPAPGAAIAGRLSLDSRDLGRLTGWYQGAPPRPLAIRSLRLAGDLRHGAGETRILDATVVADEMRLGGAIRLDATGARPKLMLDLAADQLDIAKLPELPESDQPGLWDLALSIDARRVRYAGVGAGDIALRLRKEGDAAVLDDLTIRNLDGADLTARGVLGGAQPRLDLRLQAKRMDAILQLADRLSSYWGIPILATRAASLAPADLAMTIAPTGGDRRITAKGRLGETEIDAVVKLTPSGALAGADALDLRFKAPNPAGLLRQIGLEVIPLVSAGPVDMRLTGGGVTAASPVVNWTLKGLFGGLDANLEARQTASLVEPLAGRVRLAARDLAPLAQTLLIAVPAVAPGQDLQLDAGFDLRGYRITLRDLSLRSGGSRVRGEIAFNLAEFGRVSGQLRIDRVDAATIAPLLFGSPPVDRLAAGWDSRPFGPAAAATLPGDLWIEADALNVAGLAIAKPRFVVRFDNGLIFLEHAEGEWLGGRLTGGATLRRSDAAVSLSGRFGLENARLDRLPIPAAQGLPGRVAAQLDVSAIGDSPAALVGSLSGVGRLDIREGAVAGLAPDTLGALLAATPPNFAEVTREALAAALARRLQGRLPLPQGQTTLALASGVLRAGPLRVPTVGGETTLQAALDLKDFTLNARAALSLYNAPKDWQGPPPAADVALRGPWAAPMREIDVSVLANGLTAIAIQREQERIEALEQDQRERSYFNRRLRAAEEQRRAEEEEKRRLEAQRRAEEEARKRAEEEERRRLEEERRRAEAERRAAEEARRRAEEEARRRAEAERRALEAQRRAEEEARRRAEEDERRRAEAERRAQEAQRRAEEAARIEAARRQRLEESIRTVPAEAPLPPSFVSPPLSITPPTP
jgi:hypothetical protein